ncbi:MAG: carboxypeptidase-like regulatory domain-containing protein, partial [Muribaculaceae bacterium]|nr:carboxypeptidase-like regulatory domain-containing protein [Muribaculaceae bacterium]
MRKHLYVTLLLLAGLPLTGIPAAQAMPEPQQQGQTASMIIGTVLDENNEPIIGASIKSGDNSVITDAFGHFRIKVAPGTKVEISFVGYKSVSMAAAQDMIVYMQPTTEMLGEI